MESTQGIQPVVSIFIPAYNHENFIEKALYSVFSQKVDFPVEIVVVDDCSIDETFIKAKKILTESPFPYQLVSNQKNLFSIGISPLINSIRYLNGEFIARLDGDDYWISTEKLSRQIDFFKQNLNINLCCTLSKELNESTNLIRNLEYKINNSSDRNQLVEFENLVNANFIVHSSAMFKKDSISILPKDWNELVVRDYALWGYISENKFVGLIPEYMTVHRIHKGNKWMSLEKSVKDFEEFRAVIWLTQNSKSLKAKNLWSNKALKMFVSLQADLKITLSENLSLKHQIFKIQKSRSWRFARFIAKMYNSISKTVRQKSL